MSLTTLGAPSTQQFTTLANAGTNVAWTDNSTLPGWYSTRTTYNAGTGSSNTGAMYSFGVAGTNPLTDRALGSVASNGTGAIIYAGCFTNNTGAALSSVDISFFGEQWRDGGAASPVAQTLIFEYQVAAVGAITDADTPATGWTAVPALNFSSPIFANTGGGVALDGNAPANRTAKASSITVAVPIGNQFWARWRDANDPNNDHGLAFDDFSITPQGAVVNNPIAPTCPSPVTTTAGTATTQGVSATDSDGTVISANITSITPSDPGTITLIGFTPAGGVGGTANATLDVSAATPANTYSVTIQWANNDGTPQTANCVVSVVVNPAPTVLFIHDVQGNGAATPIPGATVTIEGIVIGDFQPIPNDNRLSGFFVQEENADADADPNTSEGIFVFCSACPTNVAEGQRVQVTGTVSEFFNNTQITATTAGSVVITDAGNNLALVTPATIDLPVTAPSIDGFYEPLENMRVTYSDTLTVSEYFEQSRYGRIELFEGGRPRQFTEANPPNAAGYSAHLDNLARRRVYIDDDDNVENSVLNLPDGQQFVFHPQANGGLSIGTQGTDFFRGGDLVSGLTGILHYSFSGGTSPDEWRIRPTAATPAAFTVANTRPATAPAVGGAIKAASVNVLNYFTTLNVRGADSTAELNRQRERVSIVLCGLDADVAALMEIENHATNLTITDLLNDVNTRCGGTQPYTFVNTGGALGTDQIRVMLIYRTGVLAPVGAPLVDMDAVHNRPPTAQTFDVVDALNPAFGERITAVANHSKSKGCGGASGADLDQNDGAACFAATRLAQANRLLTWVNGIVIPAAGDPDVLLLGDFNAYAQETATAAITGAGYSDLESAFLGAAAYSYLFDGQLGHIDYAFSSASLTPDITGISPWHINADENPLFDYNDEIDDGAAEQAFEEKPDGSALAPPRVLFQPASPYRASDHDPVLLGIFGIADLAITKTDLPDPVTAGNNLAYTITVTNNGPDVAASAQWTDNLTDSTFVSLSSVAGWSCTTPAVGATGMITCSNPNFGVGSAVFTLTTNVSAFTAAGTILSNTANVTSSTAEGNPGDESDTETTTVAASADLSVAKSDSPEPVTAGTDLTYTITVNNAGPSAAQSLQLTDNLPAGTTFVSLSSPVGWSCTTPAVGTNGTVTCTNSVLGVGNAVFTLVVNVDASTASGASISNSATITSTTNDPNSGNETGSSETTVATSADLSVSKSDSPDPVTAGANLTYAITVNNAGPSNAATVQLTDTLPANTTFVSLSSPGGWSCTTPAVGSAGTVTCSITSLGLGNAVFTLVVAVDPATASGASISNSATVTSTTTDPNSGNETGGSETNVVTSADLSVTKSDSPDPVNAGANLTYTITVNNAGPSNAATVQLTDTLPANTTFVSLSSPGGWSCTTPAVGSAGTVTCSITSLGLGNAVFTLVVAVDPATASGTSISNSATVTSATTDPNGGNETGSSETTVSTSADLSVTKTDSPDPVNAGATITYTITVNNAGPSNAATVTLTDVMAPQLEFNSLSSPAGWSCTTPGVNNNGTITCTAATVGLGNHVFTLVVRVASATASGTIINNSATVATNATADPNPGNETGSASTTVSVSANMSLTKTDSPDPVNAGSNITYSITILNSGPSNADNVNWTDTLPAGTTFVSLSNFGGWTCTTPAVGATGTVSCSKTSSQVAGTSITFTLVVAVDPSVAAGTSITNNATVSSTTPDPVSGNETGTASTTVATSADLSVTKTDSPDPVTAGTNLTYTITLNNAGPSTADSVTFSDTVPANTTFVSLTSPGGWSCTTPAVGGTGSISCSATSLAPGNAVFTLVVNVGAAVADGTILSNTASTTTTTTDPNSGNDSDTETTTVGTGSADLSVTKSDSPDPVTPGSNLTYTINVTNAGPSVATSATLSDTLPAGTTFVSLSAAPGWSCSSPIVGATGTVSCSNPSMNLGTHVITLVVNVNASVAAGTIITNTATASSSTTEANPGDESGASTTTVGPASADLLLSKTDSPDPVTPGANLTYQITITNNGPSNAASATFSDTLPAGTTFVSLSTTGSWSCTTPAVGATGTVSCTNASFGVTVDFFTLVVAVDPSVAAGTILSNTATVASATADPTPGNESDTATTTVDAASANLSVTKTDSPDPVSPGTNLTYTITVNNAGPSNAATVTLSDTVPANTTFVSLASPGGWSCTTPAVGGTGAVNCSNASMGLGSAVFTLVVNVDASVAGGTILSNTATVASATADPTPGNESDTETTAVGSGSADLSVTKTDSPDPVVAGNNLTYTITVNNAGPSNAASASLTDNVPANTTFVSLVSAAGWSCVTPAVGGTGAITCTNASMAMGSAVFTLTVNVNAATANGTILTNTATVSSSTPDSNQGNESDTETTTVVILSADLSVTKTDSPDPVSSGSNLTYTITVDNAGPNAASTVSLTDSVPANTTFVSLFPAAGWSCTTPAVGGTGLITCTNPSMAVGNAVFTLTVNVDAVTVGTILTNTATVTSATADSNPGNESDTETTTAAGSANLIVSKTDSPDPVTPGTNLTYTITVTQGGPSAAASVTFVDNVPANTTFVSFSAPAGWTCTTPAVGGTGAINCSTAIMLPGNAVFTLVVNTNATLPAGTILSNTATANSPSADPSISVFSDTETTTVGSGSADLSVTKTDSPDPVTPGNNLTYTITVNNAGPSAATTVQLTDAVPSGTTFVSLTPPGGWSCVTPAVGGVGTITCSIASMSVGSNVFTLVVATQPSVAGVITNTATVSAATADPNSGNESGTANTTVGAPIAEVSVAKGDSPDPVAPGANITYTITVTNAGPSDGTGGMLSDTVPAGTTFVSLAAPAGWTCTTPAVGGTGAVTCSMSNFGVGDAVFTLIVAVDPSALDGTVITNTATFTATSIDPTPGNESATTTTTVSTDNADLSLSKTDDADPVIAGNNLTYTLTVLNAGPDAATNAVLTDTLPAETTFVSVAAPAGWTCVTPAVGATGVVTCSNASMAVGSAAFTLVVNVAPGTVPNTVITNNATVASAVVDPNPGSESDSETTTVISPASVSGTKTAAGPFTPGSNVTYTIVLSNAGPGAQFDNPGNEFTDVLPAQLTLISAVANSGTAVANVGTNTVTWNGSIAAGGTVTITIQALLEADVAPGTTVSNQGTISFDGDGNGTNESSAFTNGAPTIFTVALPTGIDEVPALDGFGLAILATMLAALGLVVMRRA